MDPVESSPVERFLQNDHFFRSCFELDRRVKTKDSRTKPSIRRFSSWKRLQQLNDKRLRKQEMREKTSKVFGNWDWKRNSDISQWKYLRLETRLKTWPHLQQITLKTSGKPVVTEGNVLCSLGTRFTVLSVDGTSLLDARWYWDDPNPVSTPSTWAETGLWDDVQPWRVKDSDIDVKLHKDIFWLLDTFKGFC